MDKCFFAQDVCNCLPLTQPFGMVFLFEHSCNSTECLWRLFLTMDLILLKCQFLNFLMGMLGRAGGQE